MVVAAALTVAATVVAGWGALGHGKAVLTAALRALAQLAAVALVITVVLERLPLTAAFLAVMATIATVTAGRRITKGAGWWWASVPILAGTVPALGVVLATGVVPPRGVALVPIGGILIGGAMTATALSGRRAADELTTRKGEIEAALALGMLPHRAVLEVCRPAAATSLLPVIDQTRTVGLVTLPGAFVGMLLGGATPLEAAAVQLLVLVSLLGVQGAAVLVTVWILAAGRFFPVPR
jgi:putative ABC transport system permease protein